MDGGTPLPERADAGFTDRPDAGRQLAGRLRHLVSRQPVVLGLPRGGVPVAAQVAGALGAPLDVILVRKLGVPDQPELAVGAIGEGGVRVMNEEVRLATRVPAEVLADVEARERRALEQRAADAKRHGRRAVPLSGRCVVVVDDGIATGSTAAAACAIARTRGASWVVLAAPVAPALSLARLSVVADELDVVHVPEDFFAIGQWYADFSQTTDTEVRAALSDAADRYRRPHGNHE